MLLRSAFLALAVSALPAAAAQPYDGSWLLSVTTQSGTCSSYSWDVSITEGRIQTPSGLPVTGSGNVTSGGKVAVQFTTGSDVMTASGQANRNVASGRWNAPTLACSGAWSAQRRS